MRMLERRFSRFANAEAPNPLYLNVLLIVYLERGSTVSKMVSKNIVYVRDYVTNREIEPFQCCSRGVIRDWKNNVDVASITS